MPCRAFRPVKDNPLTTDRFWARLNHFIADEHVVVADAGSAAFDSLKLCLRGGADYISQSFYASIGYAIPAALGIGLADGSEETSRRSRRRSLSDDGAGAVVHHQARPHPIVFLLNNDGYQIERVIYDNDYNNLQMWDYTMLPAAVWRKTGEATRD